MNYKKLKKILPTVICTGLLFTGTCLVSAEEPVSQNASVQSEHVSTEEDHSEIDIVSPDNVDAGNVTQDITVAEDTVPDIPAGEDTVQDIPVVENAVQDSSAESIEDPETDVENISAQDSLSADSSSGNMGAETPAQDFVSGEETSDPESIPAEKTPETPAADSSDQKVNAAPADSNTEGVQNADVEEDAAGSNTEIQSGTGDEAPSDIDITDEIISGTADDVIEGSDKEGSEEESEDAEDALSSNTDVLLLQTSSESRSVSVAKAGAVLTKATTDSDSAASETAKTNTEKTVTTVTKKTAATATKKTTAAAAKKSTVAAAKKNTAAALSKTTAKKVTAAKTTAKKVTKQLIPNGVYSFLSALNPFKALDISGASKANRANAQAYDLNNSDAQHFRITYHPKDGTYSIMNVRSKKYLDVNGGINANGTNVQQYTGNNTRAQRWVVKKLSNGNYVFLSALGKHNKALDLAGGASSNGTNLQIYASNGTKAQQFKLQKYNPSLKVDVKNGVYVLSSSLKANGKAVVDISGGSMNNGANAQLYAANGTAAQQFSVTNTDGAYRIMSCNSGRVLSIQNGQIANGANVLQDQTAGLDSQKWQIMDAGDGTVYIKSATADVYLDVSGGRTSNGTNIQVYQGNGTKAQKFKLKKQTKGPVANGVYFIENAVDPSMTMDIRGGSKKMQANVQIYEKNGTAAQKFRFTRGSDGLYTILNCNSGHSLDIAGGSFADGGNLQQYRTNGSLAQKWILKRSGGGSLMLINAGSGMALDITSGNIASGSNLQQYSPNGSAAQRFRLEKTTGTVNPKPNYAIEPPLVTLQYPQANAVLNRVGRNLRAAHNWSAGLSYADCGMDISAGSRALANKAFTTNTGDCYTMAASLYEMAKVLGYNAHQMFGYVPLARGGMGVHSWVEIDQGGSTYICDPDFQNETGGNGYMIHYGMSGTWRYTDYRRIN